MMAAPATALSRSPPVTRHHSDMGEGSSRRGSNLGEVAGGATAVACCFPLAVVDLAVLAVYKVPAGICRKAKRKNKKMRMKRKKKIMSVPAIRYQQGLTVVAIDDDMSLMVPRHDDVDDYSVSWSDDVDGDDAWHHINGNGFWRSDDLDEYCDHQ